MVALVDTRSLGFACMMLFAFVCGALLFVPTPLFAQMGMSIAGESSLTVAPLFPQPFTETTVSLDAYTLDTTGASITWKLDGKALPQFEHSRSITFMTGAIGIEHVATADVRLLNGQTVTLRRSIKPTSLDIIVEANTYIPPFFKGRALPSAEASVRLVAIVHGGAGIDPAKLTYRWELDGEVLFLGPIRGRRDVTVTMPRYRDTTLIVTVTDDRGMVVAQRAMALEPTDPELHFYEENPLRGLSQRAIDGNHVFIGDETTIHGEPYYLSETDLTLLDYRWFVNGERSSYLDIDPHILTLRKEGTAGSAFIEARVLSERNVSQYVRNDFTITF